MRSNEVSYGPGELHYIFFAEPYILVSWLEKVPGRTSLARLETKELFKQAEKMQI